MKSIRDLVIEIKTERPKEFNAFNIIDDNIKDLLSRVEALEKRNLQYYSYAYSNNNQSLTTGVVTPINLELTQFPQLGNMHDNVNDNDKIFIRRNGIYVVSGISRIAANATGQRQIIIQLIRSGATFRVANSQILPNAAYDSTLSACGIQYLYVGDYLQLCLYQDSGGPLNSLAVPANIMPRLVVMERKEDLDPSQYGLLNPDSNTY